MFGLCHLKQLKQVGINKMNVKENRRLEFQVAYLFNFIKLRFPFICWSVTFIYKILNCYRVSIFDFLK